MMTKLGKGQRLFKRAKNLIPGGTMLLSKRPELYLPKKWPTYFKKAKGCTIWDLDNNKYIDISMMGVGTNILGYSNEVVDLKVRETIEKGNMSTFNCPEEVLLAEKLVDLHPWASMVRLTRTGGEANAVAIRIARAAVSGRDKIAICGYHGWHDWYLAANLNGNKNLENHLLPGLEPKGVPSELKGSIFPFNYNDFEALERIVKNNSVGIIKMEVSRNLDPKNNFLANVRELATKNNIVLIFDECTSGFRETFGGLHLKYGVIPDIAVFGKALGNGYAINAVIGKTEIMQEAQSSFISSTFWTERIGPTAALATLDLMEKIESWNIISIKGDEIKARWKKIGDKHNLNIDISGLRSLPSFKINSGNWLKYKTFITQEMLKEGILATNIIYVSIAHKNEFFEKYFYLLDKIFKDINSFENGEDINEKLDGPICHSGFERLN